MIVIHRGFETHVVFKSCGFLDEKLKDFDNLLWVKSAWFCVEIMSIIG